MAALIIKWNVKNHGNRINLGKICLSGNLHFILCSFLSLLLHPIVENQSRSFPIVSRSEEMCPGVKRQYRGSEDQSKERCVLRADPSLTTETWLSHLPCADFSFNYSFNIECESVLELRVAQGKWLLTKILSFINYLTPLSQFFSSFKWKSH